MLRALIHHWRMSLAVAAGAAVATAVLTGALLVGDSVRGSLRDLTLERLGAVDLALAGQRFVPQTVTDRLRQQLALDGSQNGNAGLARTGDSPARELVGAVLLQGSARHTSTRRRASAVGVQGVGRDFFALFGDGEQAAEAVLAAEALFAAEPGPFPPVLINQTLADELGAGPGDPVTLALKRWSEVPRGSLLGRKGVDDTVQTVPLQVAEVLPDRGLGSFGLDVHQGQRRNAFLRLEDLQEALGEEGRINAMLVALQADADPTDAAEQLGETLRGALTLEDLGLTLEPLDLGSRGGALLLESTELLLRPEVLEPAGELAEENEASGLLPLFTYLVNGFRAGERSVPYSTITALDPPPADSAFGDLRTNDGNLVTALAEGEILVNTWLAEELQVGVGDRVILDYFAVGPREELLEREHELQVAGVVNVEGLAADPRLSQEVPGVDDAADMRDWDPPFPVELERIRPQDEEYWDLYRATPKAFISLAQGQDLWRSRWGQVTGLRIAPPTGQAPGDFAPGYRQQLEQRLPLASWGLAFQPVKQRGLEAAAGSTDFGGLFIGFSMFLIASAAMVAALLFRLGVERRAGEVGLRRALGFPLGTVRRQLLGEGVVVALAGGLVGLLGAVAYGTAMMALLRTWWRPAVGTSALELHVSPVTLLIGLAASVIVVLFAIAASMRRLAKVPLTTLLARSISTPASTRAGRLSWLICALTLGAAIGGVIFALVSGRTTEPALFFAIGPLLLVGLLALLAVIMGRPSKRGGFLGSGTVGRLRLAAGNSTRHRGRSLLASALVAAATFLIVTVAAFQHDFAAEELGPTSGTGGYALVASSDVPLHQDLGSPDGRFELGLPDAAEERLAGAGFTPMRLLPGDDTSCLNLYRPEKPRILGVPPEMIERGGFSFRQALAAPSSPDPDSNPAEATGVSEENDNPWQLLEADFTTEEDRGGPPVIPAFGDANSMQWILKLALGQDLEMKDGAGQPIKLRLVGMLDTSVFQSELLISESHFRTLFPDQDGFSYFLIDTPEEQQQDLAQSLEQYLEPYGFDAIGAGEKLAAFHAVQNTYLSTFRTLGGLGLLLGTVGLAIILVRNLLERQGELAALRAFGFRRGTLTWMVVAENFLLLLAGLLVGTVAALVTTAPNLLEGGSQPPWAAIVLTLVTILFFGVAACSLAAYGTLRRPLMPALKAER